MPYELVPQSDGTYKVCKLNNDNICFSKKGIPKSRAIKQMKAIGINEGKGRPGRDFSDKENQKKGQRPFFSEQNLEINTSDNNLKNDILKNSIKLSSEKPTSIKLQGGLKSLFRRIGGKTRLKKLIVNDFFPNDYEKMTYVEPFIGGGSIFFYKNKSNKEIINDKDKDVINLFRGFKKYDGYKISKEINGNYTKEDFIKIKESKPKTEFNKFIRLLKLYKLSFFGQAKSYGNTDYIKSDFKNKYKDRLKDTIILNDDYAKVINKYDSENTLFYLDPPYEKSDKLYKFDYVNINDIYKILSKIKGKFILSYNNSKEAKELFKNYNIYKVKTKYARTGKEIELREVTEIIITNFKNKEGGAKPKDIKLYESIKEKVYEEQPKHSLYRSARIAKEYKKAGGEYTDDDKPKMNINKWFNQKWISINDFLRGDVIPCGNSDTKKKYDEYPLCRPLAIAELLTKTQMKKMIKEKNKLEEKPLISEKVLDTDKFNIKSTLSGTGASFFNQLNKIDYEPKAYLKDARKIAKKRGYNPKLLNFSNKKNKKLNYNGVDFGQVNYNDFLIYQFLEKKGDIPKGEANKKMANYRARATKIKGDWALSKESPNSLAIKILWGGCGKNTI